MWQNIIVILLLILAGIFILRRLLKSWKKISGDQPGCPGCGTCAPKLKVYSKESAESENETKLK